MAVRVLSGNSRRKQLNVVFTIQIPALLVLIVDFKVVVVKVPEVEVHLQQVRIF